jgi:hypothetical protein
MDGNRDNIDVWTLMSDGQIFSLIESEFAIEPNEDLIGAETVADLLRVLQDRGAFRE